MFSRNALVNRQDFARDAQGDIFAFALMPGLHDDQAMQSSAEFTACNAVKCYPSLSPWPGPNRVGPSFATRRRGFAYVRISRNFRFENGGNGVSCANRTTNQRGSSRCVNPLSFFLWQSCRLQAVFSPIQPLLAQVLALFRVRLLARSRITRLQNLLWSVAHLARLLATQVLAADLTAPTKQFGLKASCGTPAAGFSHFAPARALKGREPCSRKS